MKTSTQLQVVAAAVKTPDGVIHFMPAPHRHHHVIHLMSVMLHPDTTETILTVPTCEQGFILSDGTFASREQGANAAVRSGQIKAPKWPPKLYSEDLW